MSELKLYAVKNDEGKYWDFSDNDIFWSLAATRCPTTSGRNLATFTANEHGGHVVTLVEEPEKVVLSEKQAKIVEGANKSQFPASYISDHTGSSYCLEKLLMDAYANGYTVAKEKEYNVKVPHTSFYYWKKLDGGLSVNDFVANDKYDAMKFTEAEIEHYGLQDCEKIWCDSDD
ncbi:DUF1642 domain-containing protein [Lacticaseibacillus parahuelsenbergensis]|uniref:DUF1642 domain-containing protein n=1 Tax=Lacticaseibacillus parahuelsenbergensis TaxID=3068305 RepID=A0ABY9L459_9LACO|nr:DUF1642 domain-containing protein [Lacticaseibacillus sp. NCIMB 15471]WLV78531.1 DUF1642 domain-containing protein [Lacticaseibacillus sp. NCIMB 15471]